MRCYKSRLWLHINCERWYEWGHIKKEPEWPLQRNCSACLVFLYILKWIKPTSQEVSKNKNILSVKNWWMKTDFADDQITINQWSTKSNFTLSSTKNFFFNTTYLIFFPFFPVKTLSLLESVFHKLQFYWIPNKCLLPLISLLIFKLTKPK